MERDIARARYEEDMFEGFVGRREYTVKKGWTDVEEGGIKKHEGLIMELLDLAPSISRRRGGTRASRMFWRAGRDNSH